MLKCLVEMLLKLLYLTTWVGGSTQATLFVSRLQNQGCVWTLDFFFFFFLQHKQNGKLADREEIFSEFDSVLD